MPAVTWDAPVGNSVSGHWMATASSLFQLQAFDSDGFPNGEMTDYQVIVRPDQPPQIQVTRPGRNEECTPQAMVPLRAVAEDDFGIKSLKLIANKLGDKPVQLASVELMHEGQPTADLTWAQLETAGEIRRWQADYSWDISKLDPAGLKSGDVIEYYMEVQDNFAFEGQTHPPVASGKYRITILSQEQFGNLIADQIGQVREQVVQIRNNQRAIKDETGDLRQQTQSRRSFQTPIVSRRRISSGGRRRRLRRPSSRPPSWMTSCSRMVENRAQAQDLKDIAQQASSELSQVAEHPMKDAAGQIDNARNQRAPQSPSDARQPNNTSAQPRNGDQAAVANNAQRPTDESAARTPNNSSPQDQQNNQAGQRQPSNAAQPQDQANNQAGQQRQPSDASQQQQANGQNSDQQNSNSQQQANSQNGQQQNSGSQQQANSRSGQQQNGGQQSQQANSRSGQQQSGQQQSGQQAARESIATGKCPATTAATTTTPDSPAAAIG